MNVLVEIAKDQLSEYEELIDFKDENHGFMPSDIKKWAKTCDEQHSDIRELMEGSSVAVDFQIKSPEKIEECAHGETVVAYLKAIYEIIPQYFAVYKLVKEDLLKEKIGKVKTTKHVSSFVLKTYGNQVDKQINNYLSILKEMNKNAITTKGHYKIVLDTTPMGFAKIGHYICDSESCFKQGRSRDSNKYLYAIYPNTFVILIKVDSKNVCRCLGWYDKKTGNFATHNTYARGINKATITVCIERILEEISPKAIICRDFVDGNSIKTASHCGIARHVYHNGDGKNYRTNKKYDFLCLQAPEGNIVASAC